MSKLEELQPGLRIEGLVAGQSVSVVHVTPHGTDAVALVYRTADGDLSERVIGRDAEPSLSIAAPAARPFDADASEFKLVAECQRIRLAAFADPMLAVTSSDIQPLPHQLRAVYEELLPRAPLRFLLADDPGAGKTIMAGLYIKELMLREDVRRCLIVAPGGLVEQWQDELYLKFGLRFELFSPALGETLFGGSAFDQHPRMIARMDQLARNDELLAELQSSEWDLVVVDEAHRMGAHYFAGKLEKTRRFELGEKLGQIARHLLLMTATPHSGKEEDFQLFLTLLDRDRFEGKYKEGVHDTDTDGVMRRMVKEDLLTFEGKPLFPERIAETVPYELTQLEQDLYEEVTQYVRQGMNRAAKLDGKRRNTVGFALTVLQRRLASSPEAIFRSLQRRSERLEQHKKDLLAGKGVVEPDAVKEIGGDDYFDDEEFSAEELEEVEEELVDAATAARTVEELDVELAELADLIQSAARVRSSGSDKKWSELSKILQDNTLALDGGEGRRKLIVFTEHRDTLEYLGRRIGSLLGRPDAVQAIHGGVGRADRRQVTAEFTSNPACQVLLATDAAGEGLNLQVAHLMVNYDLPWNPNRIEQRFGRIHRIGQHEVCRLWNLVAENTREGDVFTRLLAKIDEQRKAYGGKVFDVLGAAFGGAPLRKLLIEAIRYGDLPETRAQMHQVIDAKVGEGIDEMLGERALASNSLPATALAELRAQMDEARARRLQPHYIEGAFRAAFTQLGGKISKREKGRFEIKHVPAALRLPGRPIASSYERVTFDPAHVLPDGAPVRAELLAPGSPLLDAVIDEAIGRWQPALERGAVLVSPAVEQPQVLVGLVNEVADATGTPVGKRFSYAFVDRQSVVTPAGPAPYLDCVAAPDGPAVEQARQLSWLVDAETDAASWIIKNDLPDFVKEVTARRRHELEHARAEVDKRLHQEYERLQAEAMVAREKEDAGDRVRESSRSLEHKSEELQARRAQRLELFDKQLNMQAKTPRVVTAALVLPPDVADEIEKVPLPVETKAVERRGVDLVMASERELGRKPVEQAFNNPGFDVFSATPDGEQIRIEVKARIAGSDDFYVTHNEVLTALNSAPRYRLALVRVDPDGPDSDEVRYVADPFDGFDAGEFAASGHRGKWDLMWEKGSKPF